MVPRKTSAVRERREPPGARPPGARPPGARPADVAVPALIIFAVAFLLRLIYTLQSQANPQFDTPLMDPGFHDAWAWQLASGTWEAVGPFFRAPLYPFFLAGVYTLAGHDYLIARLVQALLGSASCVLIFLIGRRLFSVTTGLIAGLGAAVYWILIYFDNELLIPVLFVFLILLFFYTLLLGLGEDGRQRVPYLALSGAFYGLAVIARPNILIFLPVLLWQFYRAVRRGAAVRGPIVFLLIALVPIAAVTVYNTVIGDDFVVIASQGGVNFYIGNNELSDGRTAIVPGTRADWWGGRYDTIKIAEREMGHVLKDSEVSRYWFRKALDYIAAQPGQWLSLTLRKLGLFWSAAEIGNNASIYHLRSYARIMRLPLLGFGILAPLALAGAYLAWARRRASFWLPFAFVGLYMLGVVAFFVCARYRVPVIPFLLLFAAFAVTEGVTLWKRGPRAPVLAAAALFVVAALVVNGLALGHEENFALARFHDGVAWKQKGSLAQAERAYRDALRLDPQLAAARTNLANLLAERGDAGSAARAFEQAIAADPRDANAWTNLASHHLQAGDLAAANSALTRALRIDPDFSPALRVLGVVRERRGDLVGAREAYTRALRFTREAHRLENNVGVVAIKEGDAEAAERHFRRAIELDASYAIAWRNLGGVLASAGNLAEAVPALERATTLDPRDGVAWQQLADVYQALGRGADAERARQRARGSGGDP